MVEANCFICGKFTWKPKEMFADGFVRLVCNGCFERKMSEQRNKKSKKSKRWYE